MKKFFPIAFLLCINQLYSTGVAAQSPANGLISVNFQDLEFEQFIKELEEVTNYHFYYNTNQEKGLKISVNVEEKPLSFVLGQALEGTGLLFAIEKKPVMFLLPVTIKFKRNCPTAFLSSGTLRMMKLRRRNLL